MSKIPLPSNNSVGKKVTFSDNVTFLEDTKKDTMAYIGKLKVNIAFGDLFSNNIHIKSLALENVNANLNRTEKDSLFNFNFLLQNCISIQKSLMLIFFIFPYMDL